MELVLETVNQAAIQGVKETAKQHVQKDVAQLVVIYAELTVQEDAQAHVIMAVKPAVKMVVRQNA